MNSYYPFQKIIITFPDEKSAEFANSIRGPLRNIQQKLMEQYDNDNPNNNNNSDYNKDKNENENLLHNDNNKECIQIIATTDPYNVRVGSGGGTIAALCDHDHDNDNDIDDDDDDDIIVDEDTNDSANQKDEQQKQAQQRKRKKRCSVLLLHAGGESSRCPTQMVLGKAFTSLPIRQTRTQQEQQQRKVMTTTCMDHDIVITPLEYWILTLCPILFHSIPQGSVVVIASDTLLHIPPPPPQLLQSTLQKQQQQKEEESFLFFDKLPRNAVIGLAVPAPLDTAKNHGVFIIVPTPSTSNEQQQQDNTNNNNEMKKKIEVYPCRNVLQKPSISVLDQEPYHSFYYRHPMYDDHDRDEDNGDDNNAPTTTTTTTSTTIPKTSFLQPKKYSWIDTGVTIFLPEAANVLYQLGYDDNGPLRACTKRGLQSMYNQYIKQIISRQNEKNDEVVDTTTTMENVLSLNEFVTQKALKIDLYTHLLQALRLENDDNNNNNNNNNETLLLLNYQKNLQQDGSSTSISNDILSTIYQSLHSCSLYVWTIQDGAFLHLGTTLELHEFYIHGTKRAPILLVQPPKYDHDPIVDTTLPNNNNKNPNFRTDRQYLCQRFGQQLHFIKDCQNLLLLLWDHNHNTRMIHPSCVILNSMLQVKQKLQQSNTTTIDVSSLLTIVPSFVPNSQQYHHQQHPSYIGYNTVIEHCCYSTNSYIQIGSNCLVSGLRSSSFFANTEYIPTLTAVTTGIDMTKNDDDDKNDGLLIPDNMIVQMLPLTAPTNQNDPIAKPRSYTLLVLGITDDIKDTKLMSIYGQSLDYFLQFTGCKEADIWDNSVIENQKCMIWNAKIHPILSVDGGDNFNSLFNWLRYYQKVVMSTENISNDMKESVSHSAMDELAQQSLIKWKQSKRLALCEIRDLSDSYHEFDYRIRIAEQYIPQTLQSHHDTIRDVLLQRKHCSIDLHYITNRYTKCCSKDQTPSADGLLSLLHFLDSILMDALRVNDDHGDVPDYDICARILMLSSSLFHDLALSPLFAVQTVDKTKEKMDSYTSQFTVGFRQLRWSLVPTLCSVYSLEFVQKRDQMLLDLHAADGHDGYSIVQALAIVMERMAQIMTARYLSIDGYITSFEKKESLLPTTSCFRKSIWDQWCVTSAPARVDLAGGWSDTPPICYEFGGMVVGAAVCLNNVKPLAARCRLVRNQPACIKLRSESRNIESGLLQNETIVTIHSIADLSPYSNPASDCSLLMCVLIQMGLVPAEIVDNNDVETGDLQFYLKKFCNLKDDAGDDRENVGLELISTSFLPQGSGLGTSSILAGCLVGAVGVCNGMFELEHESITSYNNYIIDAVLQVEQLLSTGGGYQDQVNGLYGGVKCSQSLSTKGGMSVCVERMQLQRSFEEQLSKSIVLIFTGQIRLAKNILSSVLRQWSTRTPEILETVRNLVQGAKKCKEYLLANDLHGVGQTLTEYWELKKRMAGTISNVEPPMIGRLMQLLTNKNMNGVLGASLCGAGGGGFLVVLVGDGVNNAGQLKEQLIHLVSTGVGQSTQQCDLDVNQFMFHDCKISDTGLTTNILTKENSGNIVFDLAWLKE